MSVFSLGLDEIAKTLRRHGYQARVSTAIGASLEAAKMRDEAVRAGDNVPLIVMGHSLGADRAPKIAVVFSEKNVQVDLMVLLDSTMPGNSLPANVKRCVNFYQTKSPAGIFNGKRIRASSNKTEMINIDIASMAGRQVMDEINHFTLDTHPWIQQLLVDTVDRGMHLVNQQRFEQYIHEFADQHSQLANEIQPGDNSVYARLTDEPEIPETNKRR